MLAIQTQFGLTFEPLIRLPQKKLDFIESLAAQRSGRAQADFGGMMVVLGPVQNLEAAAQVLLASRQVEWVYFSTNAPPPPGGGGGPPPPCKDIPEPTVDYYAIAEAGSDPDILNYHAPVHGIDMICAREQFNARGQNVRIADIDGAYQRDHEDLCSCTVAGTPGDCNIHEPLGQTFIQDDHGTKVLGILAARDNLYGWLGLVPEANVHFFTEQDQDPGPGGVCPGDGPPEGLYCAARRATSIMNGIDALLDHGNPGDKILLEMQTTQSVAPGLLTSK